MDPEYQKPAAHWLRFADSAPAAVVKSQFIRVDTAIVHVGQCGSATDRTCSLVGGSPRLLMTIGWTRHEIHALAVIAPAAVNERPPSSFNTDVNSHLRGDPGIRSAGLVRVRRASRRPAKLRYLSQDLLRNHFCVALAFTLHADCLC